MFIGGCAQILGFQALQVQAELQRPLRFSALAELDILETDIALQQDLELRCMLAAQRCMYAQLLYCSRLVWACIPLRRNGNDSNSDDQSYRAFWHYQELSYVTQ